MSSCSPCTLFNTRFERVRHKRSNRTHSPPGAITSDSVPQRGRIQSDTDVSTNASLNTSGRTCRKVKDENSSEISLEVSPTTGYRAPYHRLPSSQRKFKDLVYFREGHTLDKHLEAIGRTKEDFNGHFQSFIVSRWMDKDELERARRDPGVEKVVQVTSEMHREARSKDRTLIKVYGQRGPAPGYIVSFSKRPLSLYLHFMRIRQIFNDWEDLGHGYFVKCPESKLDKIFSDPNVSVIQQNSYVELH